MRNYRYMTNQAHMTRRRFLATSFLILPQFGLAGSFFDLKTLAATRELEATPSCGDADGATPQQTAGPFFKARSPERKSLLEAGVRGSRIILEGSVRSTKCQPIHNALVDFWQADANGDYDNSGFRLRGHQFTDGVGKYRLDTIVPGVYPGRTRHFHVRVQAPNGPLLTTQLYFPGEAENRRDGIFNPKLLMAVNDSVNVKAASFDFVLR
jgi:protocatechuate 3,4-dioxygenase beta subunit